MAKRQKANGAGEPSGSPAPLPSEREALNALVANPREPCEQRRETVSSRHCATLAAGSTNSLSDPTQTIESLAVRAGKSERSIRMTLSLAFTSPVLAMAAMEGRLPRGFCIKRLTDLPMLWSEQWHALGLLEPVEQPAEPS
jgi:hypothetical protein